LKLEREQRLKCLDRCVEELPAERHCAPRRLWQQFTTALRDLEKWFERAKVPHTLIGGIAVSLIAQPRATRDIDVCISVEQKRWPSLIDSGKEYGFVTRIDDAVAFAARSRVFLLVHEPTGIKVDISISGLPFEKEMLSRAVTIAVGDFEVKVPSPEDLVISKAVAHRARDLVDIESIIESHPQLDLGRVRRLVKEFAAVLEMPELFDDLEKILSSHQR
jgi:predicted nucleotidyltransferase